VGSNLTGGVDSYAGYFCFHFVLCRYCLNTESRVALGLIVSHSVLVWSLPGVKDQIFVCEFYAIVVLSRSALSVESVDLSIVRSHRLCWLYRV
jgi:hypothetical protein